MRDVDSLSGMTTEDEFAALVAVLSRDAANRPALRSLLREDHVLYDERSAAEVSRMRGWLLLAIARLGLTDAELPYVLEELETGLESYPVAAAAFSLRSYPAPSGAFAPFLLRGIASIRSRDDVVALEAYGGWGEADSASATTVLGELLESLAWLGPSGAGSLPEIRQLLVPSGGLPVRMHERVRRVITAIASESQRAGAAPRDADCCDLGSLFRSSSAPAADERLSRDVVASIEFEDQDGNIGTYGELFRGQPTIVAFFYTRCDNPLKCSLTITRLAEVQRILEDRREGEGERDLIRTAAITYDPDYDTSARLRNYGRDRGVCFGPAHRLLRTTSGFDLLRRHFALGVNFVDSVVNRHRIEVYILDREGRIAASFERRRWDPAEVVDRALAVSQEPAETRAAGSHGGQVRSSATFLTTIVSSVGVALIPKCPVCWAAYLSALGIAGADQIPYAPWLAPLLTGLMFLNLAALGVRARRTGRFAALAIAAAGMGAILVGRSDLGMDRLVPWGLAATLVGVIWCVLPASRRALPA